MLFITVKGKSSFENWLLENKEHRNKTKNMCSINLWQRSQEYIPWRKVVSSTDGVAKTVDSSIPKNETGLLSYTRQKNQLKLD